MSIACRKRLQRLRAIFGKATVAPLAPASDQQEGAASAAGKKLRKKDATKLIASSISGSNKNQKHHKAFLTSVSFLCHQQKGVNLPLSKDVMGAQIREIMVASFFNLTPEFILAMATVSKLSKFQPPFNANVKGNIVTWAFQLVLNGSPSPNLPDGQALQEKAESGLSLMLQALVREDPSGVNLVRLLDPLAYWMHSRQVATRAKAVSLGSTLLQYAAQLPILNLREDPALGHLVVQLAISLADPQPGIRENAKEAVSQLCRMVLRRKGLRSKGKEPMWEEDPRYMWKKGYLYLIHVGEVFQDQLTREQRHAYMEAALENALHMGQEWVREGGVFLLYSLLGQARELLEEEEEEDVKRNLAALLYNLWRGREVPNEIMALLPKKGCVDSPNAGNCANELCASFQHPVKIAWILQ